MTTSNSQSVPHLNLSRGRNIAQITVEEEDEDEGRNIAQITVEEEDEDEDGLKWVEMTSLDRRVDWNIKNSDGDTPIMYCLKTNKIEMFRLLLNSPRVDLNTRDRDGKYLEDIARYKVLID